MRPRRSYEVSHAFGGDGQPVELPDPAPAFDAVAGARGWAAENGAAGFVVLVGPGRRRYFLREQGGRTYRRVAEWDYRLDQAGRMVGPDED